MATKEFHHETSIVREAGSGAPVLNSERENEILLSLSEDIARVRSREDLLGLINSKLKELLPFHHGVIGIIDKNSGYFKAFLGEFLPPDMPELESYYTKGFPPKNFIVAMGMASEYPLLFNLEELSKKIELPVYTRLCYEAGMKELMGVPLKKDNENLGFLRLYTKTRNCFNEHHLKILHSISGLIAIAVDNILAYEEIIEQHKENSMLHSLAKDITSCRTYQDVKDVVFTKLSKYYQFNESLICLNNPDNLTYSCYMHMVDPETENNPVFSKVIGPRYFINDGFYNKIQESKQTMILDIDELMLNPHRPPYIDFWQELNVKEIIAFPLETSNGFIGVASLYPKEKNTFTPEALQQAQSVSSYLGIALSNIRTLEMIHSQLEEINTYKAKLEKENLYLQEQIKTTYDDDEIVGIGNGLRNVFKLVSSVAPSDSTVLIQGETGTGKELVARAIHKASPRKQKLMIKVNSATLPSNLVESELFGHEKGSFTGAIERRIGKFELANHGTIFLDEIGELSLDLQAKLLRALQEKEIERIGGNSVIKIDVRVIAASNRDLRKEVEAGKFRSDLFYRLNVFPITLPPLRERKNDIPALVAHFIQKFSVKARKSIKEISPKIVSEMMVYSWPGNVRELEHVIERAVLMSTGDSLNEINLLPAEVIPGDIKEAKENLSLEENERAHILSTLKKTNGKIRGDHGAAKLLNIPPTTLHSKMKKLGIHRYGE